MDYQRHYDSLVTKARARVKPKGYIEKHHVIPRSMGGPDTEDNLVCLTAREHFVAHRLLLRIHKSNEMALALNMMSVGRGKTFGLRSGKKYSTEREAIAKACGDLLRGKLQGAKNPSAKLTEGDVKEIKRLVLYSNLSDQELQKRFNVSFTAIRRIKEDHYWSHVPWPIAYG